MNTAQSDSKADRKRRRRRRRRRSFIFMRVSLKDGEYKERLFVEGAPGGSEVQHQVLRGRAVHLVPVVPEGVPHREDHQGAV